MLHDAATSMAKKRNGTERHVGRLSLMNPCPSSKEAGN
jgi:hypothetical protein